MHSVKVGSIPYVGMRPYKREEKDWFYGRGADGRIIADKVLSARLTLLYAPSGVGKSSVLNANTIPALEDEDCYVMYWDAWAGSDPIAAIKEKLAAAASSIGVVDPLAGAPTIAELARLVTGNGKTLVLVFDQFEEFLVNHANALDPLRKEVAALVRAQTIDARVLISLREEFLAALEPFRQEILTLFQSTYRLEPLTADDVRTAIVEPARFFEGEVESALADRLILDLSEGQGKVGETIDVLGSGASDWFSSLRKSSLTRSVDLKTAREAESVEPRVSAGTTGTIDLPMLQLVCEQMWRAAPITEGKRKLTLDLYKNLGGKDKILSDHIRSCMPARWWERLFTAKLMRYLAPPSGMKISYSAGDLSAYSALDKKRVEAELERLSEADARILRRREYRHEVRYELQHDALVRHVAPWRDDVLEKAALVRRVGWILAALVLTIGIATSVFKRQIEVRLYTDDRLADLVNMTEEQRREQGPALFETVVNYLLIREPGTAGLDHLKRLLVQYADRLPNDYTIVTSDRNGSRLGFLGKAPLILRYSQDRALDSAAFSQAWDQVAQRLTQRWGIPVPRHLALIADPGLTEDEMFLESGEERLLSIPVESFGENASEKVLVQVRNLVGPVNEFRKYFESDWREPRLLPSGDWLIVPRWSLPVWRAAGLNLYGVSAYPVFALEAELEKDPTLLLTKAATLFLVKHVAAQYPCTAAEVWKQRGIQLKDDLSKFVRSRRTGQVWSRLTHPHLLFDLLATVSSNDQVDQLVLRSDTYTSALRVTRRGDWPLGGSAKIDDCALPVWFNRDWDMSVFGDVQAWLPPLQPKLRLALSADLISGWGTSSEVSKQLVVQRWGADTEENQTWAKLKPSPSSDTKAVPDGGSGQTMAGGAVSALMDAFERHRREMYARTGVWLPDMSVTNAEFDGSQKHQFSIALFDTPVFQLKPVDAGGSNSEAIERVIAGLDAVTPPAIHAWIDAEFVGGLLGRDESMKKIVKDWTMPSITDLTLLLREVMKADQTDVTTQDDQVGRTIHDPIWLLRSLVFWKSFYESGDPQNPPKDLLADLAGQLRRLEARKLVPSETTRRGPALAVVERGITALYADRYREAERLFEQALKLGTHREVADIFTARYSSRWGESVRLRANAFCREPKKQNREEEKSISRYRPKSGLLNKPMLQVELRPWLERQKLERDPKEYRNLFLCLLSSVPEIAKQELLLSTATGYGDPKDWPQAQAWWLTLELLRHYDPTKQGPDLLEQGTRFMDSVVRRFKDDEASTAFTELATLCGEPGPKAWCRQLLRKFTQATSSPWISLDLAWILQDRTSATRDMQLWVDRAIELARKFQLPRADRLNFDFFTTLLKTYAQMNLGEVVDQKVVSDLLISDAVKTNPDLRLPATLLDIDITLRSEKLDQEHLQNLVENGLKEWPTNPEFLDRAARAGLRIGHLKLVEQVVDLVHDRASETSDSLKRAEFLFVASYAGLVTNHKEAVRMAVEFIRSRQVGLQQTVAMLLYTHNESKQRGFAQRRIDELWRTVDRQFWKVRLHNGDERVWYEMLLGYFKGAVSEADIFGPLRDDNAFQASELAGLGFTRQEVLTEAYFYDALRRKVDNELDGARDSLKRVVKSGSKNYIEYALAEQLLRNDEISP